MTRGPRAQLEEHRAPSGQGHHLPRCRLCQGWAPSSPPNPPLPSVEENARTPVSEGPRGLLQEDERPAELSVLRTHFWCRNQRGPGVSSNPLPRRELYG